LAELRQKGRPLRRWGLPDNPVIASIAAFQDDLVDAGIGRFAAPLGRGDMLDALEACNVELLALKGCGLLSSGQLRDPSAARGFEVVDLRTIKRGSNDQARGSGGWLPLNS